MRGEVALGAGEVGGVQSHLGLELGHVLLARSREAQAQVGRGLPAIGRGLEQEQPGIGGVDLRDDLVARDLVALLDPEGLEAAAYLGGEANVGGLDVARGHDRRGIRAPVAGGEDENRSDGSAELQGVHRVLLGQARRF